MKSVLIISLLVAVAADLVLIGYAVTRQDRSRALSFMILAAAIFLYSTGYLFEIMSEGAESAMTALKFENIGIPIVSPFFMLTCLNLYYPRLYRGWMPFAFIAYGVLISACVIFNDHHGLYYSSVEMVGEPGAYFVTLGKGPVYAIQQAVSIMVLVLTYVVLFSRYAKGNKKYRQQMRFIIVGSLVPFFANIAHFMGLLPVGFDPTPFAMTFGVLLFSIDLVRYKLMDMTTYVMSNAVNTMGDAFVALDMDWGFTFCNQSALRLFPRLGDLLGREQINLTEDWPPELGPTSTAGKVTFSRVGAAGEVYTYRANISGILAGRGRPVGWSIVIRDVTDATNMMAQLEELATLDPLTGIFNRRSFTDMVRRELAKAERHDICHLMIMYDLDFFKNVNDVYGHQAGDRVLCGVVDVVRRQLRSYDIFARYGGEEFVIFTSIDEGRNPVELPERLRHAIENAVIEAGGQNIAVTASFGVVIVPSRSDFDDALRSVDSALYEAKARGRNCVVEGKMIFN